MFADADQNNLGIVLSEVGNVPLFHKFNQHGVLGLIFDEPYGKQL